MLTKVCYLKVTHIRGGRGGIEAHPFGPSERCCHSTQQCITGRTTVFTKEVAEGEEAPEPTEEESEQGPEPLSTLDKDSEVEGGEAWTPVFSSTNSGVKNQVSICYTCRQQCFPFGR